MWFRGWYCKEKLDARLTLIFLPKSTIKDVVYLLIVTWLMNSSLVHVFRQVSNLNNLPSKQALLKGTRPNQLWNEQKRKCDCPHQMENRACWHLPWTRLSNSFYFWLKKNLVFLTQSCESGKKCCLGFKVLLVKLCAQIPGWLFLKAANHKMVASNKWVWIWKKVYFYFGCERKVFSFCHKHKTEKRFWLLPKELYSIAVLPQCFTIELQWICMVSFMEPLLHEGLYMTSVSDL